MRSLITHFDRIAGTYDGALPLTHFLKNYFKGYPVLGSRDRKLISELVFNWYRYNRAIGVVAALRELLLAWLGEKDWKTRSFNQWLKSGGKEPVLDLAAMLPYDITLSEGIGKTEWLGSMLEQPALFIRIRKEKERLLSLLREAGVAYSFISANCVSLPNGAKIDTLLPPDCYVVQDASSQRTGDFLKPRKHELWYDCCAGAGGKSLRLKDLEPGVRLTVSDKRESILYNLQQRFKLYHIEQPAAFVADAGNELQLEQALGSRKFDHIICDVPCSGSGTWARTPEQLYFFKPESVAAFAERQRLIASHVARYLKPGGRLIYITCSVFRDENEGAALRVTQEAGLQLASSQLLNGLAQHADSMYVAEFILP